MRFHIMTAFPKDVDAFLNISILGRARKAGFIDVRCWGIRDYTLDRHGRIDDYGYGDAMGVVLAIIIALLSALQFKVTGSGSTD